MAGELFDQAGNRKYLTHDERKAFLKAADRAPREVRTFCHLLHFSGCRISEALALTYDRVDFTDGTVTFESLKKRRGGVYRSVPVPLPCSTRWTWCITSGRRKPGAVVGARWRSGRGSARRPDGRSRR